MTSIGSTPKGQDGKSTALPVTKNKRRPSLSLTEKAEYPIPDSPAAYN